jgi:hypothetical protein
MTQKAPLILSFHVGPGAPVLDGLSFKLDGVTVTWGVHQDPMREIAFPHGWDLLLRKNGDCIELLRQKAGEGGGK